jgi:4-hydroxy-4-methyl-2-oxoglutarate aldolase
MGEIIIDIKRALLDEVNALKAFATGMISDCMGKTGQMNASIKPVYRGAKLAGTAVTVLCPVADNLTIHKAMEVAQPGDVLVVNAGGYPNAGLFGDVMSLAAKVKGLSGLVIDGGVRDIEGIAELGFPVFASAINPGGTVKKVLGTINLPISCGGISIKPGDIIIGDADGVVVIPREKATEVRTKASQALQQEEAFKKEIVAGKSTVELLGL